MGRLFRATMPLATGRRNPGGFGERAYLSELDHAGLGRGSNGQAEAAVLSGIVGDLIGVARKSGEASSHQATA